METVQKIVDLWEKNEQAQLKSDLDIRLKRETDLVTEQDLYNEKMVEIDRKCDEILNEQYAQLLAEGVAEPDEETKELAYKQQKLKEMGQLWVEEATWKEELIELSKCAVIKFPRILQALYFLTGMTNTDICEPNSNLFNWKRVSRNDNFVEDIAERMSNYVALQEKKSEFKKYQTINYVSELIEGITMEEVEENHPAFGKILKWV